MTIKAKYRIGQSAATLAALAAGALGLTAAPAFAGTCPNEAIREEQGSTSLPQCRAYELVTNPFKEGFAPIGAVVPIIGIDGALTYESAGNFAGDGLGSPVNQYVATRTPAGWLNVSPNPSGPAYGGNGYPPQAMSPDLRSSLWLMRLPGETSEEIDYYRGEPDGTFTRIGPAFNPATAHLEPPGTKAPGGSGGVRTAGVSADLSHVVFAVEGARAFPGPPPSGENNLYEYAGTGERPQLVGVDNAGDLVSPQGTCSAGLSADGRVALFNPGCLNTQLWARINETTSVEVSASECTRTAGDPGGACNGPSEYTLGGMSSDGSRVFFTTAQQLVNGDTNQSPDLYACNIPPGTPAPIGLANQCESLIDVSGAAVNANFEGVIRVSADGSRVYFVASGVLAANTDAVGERAVSGAHNLYVSQIDAGHPTGQTTFVTTLKSNDIGEAHATVDGRYLIFTTTNKLLATDTDEAADVYRYDADTGSLLRLSTDTSGAGGNAPGLPATLHSNSPMSADGSTVVFQTNEALSPADTNGTRDVYAWHNGQVSLISSGRPSLEQPTAEEFAQVSPSGTDIYFTTTAALTPNDIDTAPDIYDARIDGGFSSARPARCTGEACQGEPASQPTVPGSSASSVFNGPASPTPAEAPPANPPKPKPLTRAQKLARALKACKAKKDKKKRSACERQARRAYGSTR